jgi:hypothetical protein
MILQFFGELWHNCFIFDSLLVGLRPRSAVSERLATSCVLPLLLAGVLGAPGKRKELADYSRKLLFEDNSKENRPAKHTLEIINAIRFIWFVYPAYYIYIYIYIYIIFSKLVVVFCQFGLWVLFIMQHIWRKPGYDIWDTVGNGC